MRSPKDGEREILGLEWDMIPQVSNIIFPMKDVLYEVRCLKSNEDMILALTGQFKQLSNEPEKFR